MKKSLAIATGILLSLAKGGTISAAERFDPCALLTREEATTLVGEAIGVPERQDSHNPLGQKMCLYPAESSRLLQLSVIRDADIHARIRQRGQSAATVFHTTEEMLAPVETVAGVGDQAFWATPGLHLLKGETYLVVSVGNTSKRENLPLARKIAMKVLPRL